ncbi:MAG: hypothetical protein FWG63_06495 [Defluviitaleaceae bacterium]|nr:hypothetical protein [Defluviitaleaceae bacterium]
MMQLSENNGKVYTLKEIAEIAVPFFKGYKGINKVYLFGDYAEGRADETSELTFVIEKDDEQTDISLDDYLLSDKLCKNCWFNSFDTKKQFAKWVSNTWSGKEKKGVVIYKG